MECYMPYSVVNRVKYAYINKLATIARKTLKYSVDNDGEKNKNKNKK